MEFILKRSSENLNWDKPDKYIEINTLEELMELVRKEGEVIVSENIIEIYDDYRE